MQQTVTPLSSPQYLPMESLIRRHFSVSLHFLQWFKVFYDKNYKGREYNALEARGGQIFAFESGRSRRSVGR